MNYEPPMSKRLRRTVARYRKAALVASGHVYSDLARLADVSYSMVDKWMNVRRNSKECERAFQSLTRMPAIPEPELVA